MNRSPPYIPMKCSSYRDSICDIRMDKVNFTGFRKVCSTSTSLHLRRPGLAKQSAVLQREVTRHTCESSNRHPVRRLILWTQCAVTTTSHEPVDPVPVPSTAQPTINAAIASVQMVASLTHGAVMALLALMLAAQPLSRNAGHGAPAGMASAMSLGGDDGASDTSTGTVGRTADESLASEEQRVAAVDADPAAAHRSARFSDLFAWLQSQGARVDGVAVAFSGARPVLVAQRDVQAGEQLVVVPESCVMRSDTTPTGVLARWQAMSAAEPAGQDDSLNALDGVSMLALTLLKEVAKGADGTYWPYIQTLPTLEALKADDTHACVMSEARLTEACALSATFCNQALSLRRQVIGVHTTVQSLNVQYPVFTTTPSVGDIAWAHAVVYARGFLRDGTLRPLLDLAPHNDGGSRATWLTDGSGVALVASAAMSPGSIVYLHQGWMDAMAELLVKGTRESKLRPSFYAATEAGGGVPRRTAGDTSGPLLSSIDVNEQNLRDAGVDALDSRVRVLRALQSSTGGSGRLFFTDAGPSSQLLRTYRVAAATADQVQSHAPDVGGDVVVSDAASDVVWDASFDDRHFNRSMASVYADAVSNLRGYLASQAESDTLRLVSDNSRHVLPRMLAAAVNEHVSSLLGSVAALEAMWAERWGSEAVSWLRESAQLPAEAVDAIPLSVVGEPAGPAGADADEISGVSDADIARSANEMGQRCVELLSGREMAKAVAACSSASALFSDLRGRKRNSNDEERQMLLQRVASFASGEMLARRMIACADWGVCVGRDSSSRVALTLEKIKVAFNDAVADGAHPTVASDSAIIVGVGWWLCTATESDGQHDAHHCIVLGANATKCSMLKIDESNTAAPLMPACGCAAYSLTARLTEFDRERALEARQLWRATAPSDGVGERHRDPTVDEMFVQVLMMSLDVSLEAIAFVGQHKSLLSGGQYAANDCSATSFYAQVYKPEFDLYDGSAPTASGVRQPIFIHVPKAGGTTVRGALAIQAQAALDDGQTVELLTRSVHVPASAWRSCRPTAFATLPSFALVRSTWDRVASTYHYYTDSTKLDAMHGGDVARDMWHWHARVLEGYSFERFVLELLPIVYTQWETLQPQTWFTHDPDTPSRQLVGTVLQYEEAFANGAEELLRVLGIGPEDPMHDHVNDYVNEGASYLQVPASGSGPRASVGRYCDMYSPELAAVVGALYANEVVAFGFQYPCQH